MPPGALGAVHTESFGRPGRLPHQTLCGARVFRSRPGTAPSGCGTCRRPCTWATSSCVAFTPSHWTARQPAGWAAPASPRGGDPVPTERSGAVLPAPIGGGVSLVDPADGPGGSRGGSGMVVATSQAPRGVRARPQPRPLVRRPSARHLEASAARMGGGTLPRRCHPFSPSGAPPPGPTHIIIRFDPGYGTPASSTRTGPRPSGHPR